MASIPKFNPSINTNLTFRSNPSSNRTFSGGSSKAAEYAGIAEVLDSANRALLTFYQGSQQKSSEGSYVASLLSDSNLKFKELAAKSSTPDEYLELSDAYIKGTSSKLEEGVKPIFEQKAKLRASSEWISLNKAYTEKLNKRSEIDLGAAEKEARLEVLSSSLPTTELDSEVLKGKMEDYVFILDKQVEGGFLTPNQKSLKIAELQKEQIKEQAWNSISTSEAPVQLALDLLEGKSGIEILDKASESEKREFLNFAFTKQAGLEKIQNKIEKAKEGQRAMRRAEARQIITADPDSPEAKNALNKLIALIDSKEDASEVRGFQEFIENSEKKEYTQSNPSLLAKFEKDLLLGDLQESDIFSSLGNGLSTNDFKDLVGRVQRQRDSLISSPTFFLLKDKWLNEFPIPDKNQGILQALGISGVSGEDSVDMEEMRENERVMTETFFDLRNQVLVSKKIVTEEDMVSYMEAKFRAYQQTKIQKGRGEKKMTFKGAYENSSKTFLDPYVKRYKGDIISLQRANAQGKLSDLTPAQKAMLLKLIQE